MSERETNEQFAEQIQRAGQWNGKPHRPGEWIALLNGQVIAVADDLDGALLALRRLDPDPQRGMIVEVGPPAIDVVR